METGNGRFYPYVHAAGSKTDELPLDKDIDLKIVFRMTRGERRADEG